MTTSKLRSIIDRIGGQSERRRRCESYAAHACAPCHLKTVHRRYVARDPTCTRGVPTAMQKKPCRKWIRAGISRSFRQTEAAASACCRLHNQAPEGSACFYWTLICFGFCFCVSVLGMCTVRIPSLLSHRIPSALIFSGSEKLRSKLP